MEEAGEPVSIGLKKNNPFRSGGCQFGDQACIVDEKYSCADMKCIYMIKCVKCTEQNPNEKEDPRQLGGVKSMHYVGMTSTTVHNRMLSHIAGQSAKTPGNALHQHDVEVHDGVPQEYSTIVVSKCRDLLSLTMEEAIRIEYQHDNTSMNGKNERGRGAMVRLTARRTENR